VKEGILDHVVHVTVRIESWGVVDLQEPRAEILIQENIIAQEFETVSAVRESPSLTEFPDQGEDDYGNDSLPHEPVRALLAAEELPETLERPFASDAQTILVSGVLRARLVERRIGEVREVARQFLDIVLLNSEPSQALVVDVNRERHRAGDDNVQAEVKLVTGNEEGTCNVFLDNGIGLTECERARVIEENDPLALALPDWLRDPDWLEVLDGAVPVQLMTFQLSESGLHRDQIPGSLIPAFEVPFIQLSSGK